MAARRARGTPRPSESAGREAANATRPAPDRRATAWATWAAIALVVAIGLYAYAGSFQGLFVLDEKSAIIDNPNIRSLRTSFTAPPEVGLGGRPVVSFSFAVNYALAPAEGRDAFTPPPPGYPDEASAIFRRNLWGYHATNLGIHILTALAIFGIARRTLSGDRLRAVFGEAAVWLAFAMAAIWVAHPLNTGSVTYVAQRVESLMGLFYAATIYFAIRAWDGPRAGLWSAASVGACALGTGTKEILVSAPLVVALHDYVFRSEAEGGFAAVWRRRWPLYAGLAATWVLLALFVASAPRAASVGFFLEGWTPWRYLITQAGVIVHYLRLVFVPWPLVLDYEWPAASSFASVLPQAAFLAGLFALTVWGVIRRVPAAWLGAVFFLVLAPSSSVLPIVTEVAAEHRMYLPLAAVLALVVTGAYIGGRRLLGRSGPSGSLLLSAAGICAIALAVAGCVHLTRERNLDYQSNERIWSATVSARPQNSRALANLGATLVEAGRPAEAEPYLRRALEVRADYPEAQSGLGVALCMQGRLEEGVSHLERAVALEPSYRDAWRNLGEALGALGRRGQAARAFREALKTAPRDPALLKRLAWILATAPEDDVRNGAEALSAARLAVEVTGGDAVALDTLAAALAETGQFAEAMSTAQRAIAMARSAGPAELVQDLHARLESYGRGQAFRDASR
jgi:tetratricopeptide (TPR) repeat protein